MRAREIERKVTKYKLKHNNTKTMMAENHSDAGNYNHYQHTRSNIKELLEILHIVKLIVKLNILNIPQIGMLLSSMFASICKTDTRNSATRS